MMDKVDPAHHEPALTAARVSDFEDGDGLRALAERRLLKISEILGLDPDLFRQLIRHTGRIGSDTEALLKLSVSIDAARRAGDAALSTESL